MVSSARLAPPLLEALSGLVLPALLVLVTSVTVGEVALILAPSRLFCEDAAALEMDVCTCCFVKVTSSLIFFDDVSGTVSVLPICTATV